MQGHRNEQLIQELYQCLSKFQMHWEAWRGRCKQRLERHCFCCELSAAPSMTAATAFIPLQLSSMGLCFRKTGSHLSFPGPWPSRQSQAGAGWRGWCRNQGPGPKKQGPQVFPRGNADCQVQNPHSYPLWEAEGPLQIPRECARISPNTAKGKKCLHFIMWKTNGV